jgi:hypothetical protein
MRERVSDVVDEMKDELKVQIQSQAVITPVYRTLICEGIDALQSDPLKGTVQQAADELLNMPVIYPRLTETVTLSLDPNSTDDWSDELSLTIPLRRILSGEEWRVGPTTSSASREGMQFVDARGGMSRMETTEPHRAFHREFAGLDSDDEPEYGDDGDHAGAVFRIHPGAIGVGKLFEWMRKRDIPFRKAAFRRDVSLALNPRTQLYAERRAEGRCELTGEIRCEHAHCANARASASEKKKRVVAWTVAEWEVAKHGMDTSTWIPDEYVDVVHEDKKRVFKARLRGADEGKVVAEWEQLLLRPEVAAQYAYVRHISQEGAGFKTELQEWVHPWGEWPPRPSAPRAAHAAPSSSSMNI